jgi:hypothetical protein
MVLLKRLITNVNYFWIPAYAGMTSYSFIIFQMSLFIFLFSSLYADTTKVLFIGNSYTYVNDLPSLFKNLSASACKIVYTDMSAPGGYSLEQHKVLSTTIDKIKLGFWNFVILQEQSQMPVIEFYRYNSTYPSAIWLDSLIKSYGQSTMFYMTWGRKNGGQQCISSYCSPVFADFFHMQDSLKSSYTQIADSVNSYLSPVGEAWRTARNINPNVNLWDADDSHPTLEGSYLAACVFFIKVFNQSPVGLTYYGGLTQSLAQFYQQCAWQTVTSIHNNEITSIPEIKLYQNYPNPFNSMTKVKFQITYNPPYLPSKGEVSVTLKVFDILGKKVQTLVNARFQPGIYEVIFDGFGLTSGIYFYTLQIDKYLLTRKMILLK